MTPAKPGPPGFLRLLFLSPRGRLRRRTLWWAVPALGLAFLGLFLAIQAALGRAATLVLYLPFYWSAFSLGAKRYHDLDRRAYWLALLAIPILGPLCVGFELLLRRGTRGENRFGPDPRGTVDYYIVPSPVGTTVNDVTGLNPASVAEVVRPRTVPEVVDAIRRTRGPISIGGGRFSMGGQVACPGGLHLDLRGLNSVVRFIPAERTVRVQAGMRWCDLQRLLDPHDLSVKIMQSYANFTVGGSLGVNAHGRYVGLGPLILSVRSILVALADGELVEASRERRPEVFFGAIGGYGGLGVIVEAELDLEENVRVRRVSTKTTVGGYLEHFRHQVIKGGDAVFHNADIYPPRYERIRSVTWVKSPRRVTRATRLMPIRRSYPLHKYFLWAWTEHFTGQWRREFIVEPLLYLRSIVHWRNYEAGYDVGELAPLTTRSRTYALQEYFVPVDGFAAFVPRLAEILRRYRVKAVNISIRHAVADSGSLLAWARKECFAFVLYHKQGLRPEDRERAGLWTRELVEAAIRAGGTYYLPYHIHATADQFHRAYPRAREFFDLKRKLDPEGRFRNALWNAYCDPPPASGPASPDSEFHEVYGRPASRDRFYLFLQNVYHLYPEDRFHLLIQEACRTHGGDREIYEHIRREVPKLKPVLGDLFYALPALGKQKREMARQTLELLGGRREFSGYLEIGSTGRYISRLRKDLRVDGSITLINDVAPTNSPADIFERGQLSRLGTFVPLNDYQPIRPEDLPDGSVDLATCYIGLHHAPADRLDAFVRSIGRALRPGGIFIIRDHDVRTPEMRAFVSLAHAVFNAGLGIDWETNRSELRLFDTVDRWIGYVAERGFDPIGRRLLQDNDPTDNTLFAFRKSGPSAREAEAPAAAASATSPARPGRILKNSLRWTSLFLALGLAAGATADSPRRPQEPVTPKEHRRAPEQTFWTFPEWYLVFSPDEYATYLRDRRPSEFPYFGHLGQFWDSYAAIREAIRDYPPNPEYETMVSVIGASTTAEYAMKAGYETLVGRLTELTVGDRRTPEDDFAAREAREYVEFLRVQPWYEFDFIAGMKELWTDTPLLGWDFLRKWERRYFLTTEYGVKAVYGWLIKKATRASFAVPIPETATVIRSLPAERRGSVPGLKVIMELPDGSALVTLPRYEAYTKSALDAARRGADFVEIAGNRGDILVTILAPADWAPADPAPRTLFTQPILTEPGRKRLALVLPVRDLGRLLRSLDRPGIRLEHVFDY